MGMIIGKMNYNTRVIKNLDGTVAGTIRTSKSKSVKKKKKSLKYNFKGISSQVLKAKKSSNAGQVVIRARGQVANLRKKLSTGDYDSRELANAIIHAERILKVAKKRKKHLLEEENAKRQGGIYINKLEEEQEENMEDKFSQDTFELSSEEIKELLKQLEEDMQELLQEAEENNGLGELNDLLEISQGDMKPEDLDKLKKKHRMEELRDIMDADMKYLKAMFDKFAKDKQNPTSSISNTNDTNSMNNVSLELNGIQMPVQIPEVQVMPQGGNVNTLV